MPCFSCITVAYLLCVASSKSHAEKVPRGEDRQNIMFGLNANVIEIDMRFEGLTQLPNASLLNPRTKVLLLAANNISSTTSELRTLASLEVLNVSRNRLRSLRFLPEPCSLRVLDASENVIADLTGPLQTCTELELLNLTRNEVSSLDGELLARTASLKSLYLSYNKLRSVSRDAFATLSQLEDLYLNGNELRELPDGLFRGLHALKRLWMNGNRLSALPLLDACCAHLKWALFNNNAIATPSAAALRALMASDAGVNVGLYNNPIRPAALRWVLAARDVERVVDEANCACGRLRRASATVYICVATACGVGADVDDWVVAVREAAAAV
ncbi:hypothetical protein R5R35_005756 [Gryllus longicercus]|uniref:Uncharacterized protein n=1 Tax=Gryllus longicercus TaxID=2509291 RepID=A0AAN9WUC4_9ORTH